MFGLGPWELIIILVIVLIIFGAGKLPEIGSGLGKGIRNFKKATKEAKREREQLAKALSVGFDGRLTPLDEIQRPPPLPDLRLVTWFNHQRPDATKIQLEWERRVRMGPPADPRLRSAWREVYEDVVWSLINHREYVWMP